MTGLLWDNLFGFFVLGERITKSGLICLMVILLGIIVSLYDFQWSQAILSSHFQILVMVAMMLTQSVSSLFCKRAWAVLEELETEFTMVAFTFYEYFGLLLSLQFMIWMRDNIFSIRKFALLSGAVVGFAVCAAAQGNPARDARRAEPGQAAAVARRLASGVRRHALERAPGSGSSHAVHRGDFVRCDAGENRRKAGESR